MRYTVEIQNLCRALARTGLHLPCREVKRRVDTLRAQSAPQRDAVASFIRGWLDKSGER
jgi:hypothetical protein